MLGKEHQESAAPEESEADDSSAGSTPKHLDPDQGVREPLHYVRELAAQGAHRALPDQGSSEIPGLDVTPENLRFGDGDTCRTPEQSDTDRQSPQLDSEVFTPQMQAACILLEAEREAAFIRAKAQHEYQRTIEEATSRGLTEVNSDLANLLTNARALREKVIRETEMSVIKMATKVAENVIADELEKRPEKGVQMIVDSLNAILPEHRSSAACASTSSDFRIIVQLHPADLEILESNEPQFIARFKALEQTDFRGNETIGRGGCIVQTETGTIDARVSTQAESICQILLGSH